MSDPRAPTPSYRRRLAIGTSALALWVAVPPPASAATPLVLDAESPHLALLSEVEGLVDTGGVFAVRPRDPTRRDVVDAPMVPVGRMGGREGDMVWLRLSVRRAASDGAASGSDDAPWYLVLAAPYNPGTIYLEDDGGDFRAVPITLDPSGAPFVVALPPARGPQRVLMRVPFPLMVPALMHLATVSGLVQLEQRQLTQQGLYLGVVLAMLLLNLLVGLWLRDRAHLWYVAFVGASAIYFAVQSGGINRFVAPTAAADDLFRPGLSFLAAMVVTGVQFSRRFLETPRTAPRVDRVMRAYLGLGLAALAIVWLAPAPVALVAVAVAGAILPFVALTAGVVSWRAGVRAARFYLLGWSLFTASGLLFALPIALPPGLPQSVFQLGSALEAALLSLALVDRMRTLREERLLMAAARDRAELAAARADKLATLGQLVAGVAHEVNNPNNFVTFNLPILRDYLDATRPPVEAEAARDPELRLVGLPTREFYDDAHALIRNMQHGAERITTIVSQLRTYARADDATAWEEVDPNVVVRAAATLVESALKKQVRRFELDLAPDLPRVRLNPGRIEQVVVNLLVNAGHAAESVADGRVTVKTRRDDGHVRVIVEDNGPGVPDDVRARIFEPFFTTKPRGQGTGMGLAISQRIVEEHGGVLELDAGPGSPTRFVMRLPAAAPSS